MSESFAKLQRTCFVIMPFGKKTVGSVTIDFDWMFDNVYCKAARILLEQKYLTAFRADRERLPGIASTRMLFALANSRIAMADITGDNPNVHYELGFRKGVHYSGSAIVRQRGLQVPFNVRGLVRLEYDYRPRAEAYNKMLVKEIREFLRNVLASTVHYAGLSRATDELSARMGTDEQPTDLGSLVSAAVAV